MEKMRMESPDVTQGNIEKLAALFPQVVTETCDEHGRLKKAVNFALLRQLLSSEELDGDEAYEFTWVGKKASLVEAGRPIRKTLRPCVEESKHWKTTENLYIEGDNLDVLKLLQESYLGKIKMIYIDPPYNTGNDFVYKDNFARSKEDYEENAGVYDEDGDRLFRNTESNGRFHSDWCSMIYPRLLLARNLLRDDGIIFINVDDNEQENVKKICNEIFSEENFVVQLIWKNASTSSTHHFCIEHEYIIAYARNKKLLQKFKFIGQNLIIDRTVKRPSKKNPVSKIVFNAGIDFISPDKIFPNSFGDAEPINVTKGILEAKNGKLANDVELEAAWTMREMIISWLSGNTVFDQKGQVIKRFFFKENGVLYYEKEKETIHPKSVVEGKGLSTKAGGESLAALEISSTFSFPKPIGLLHSLIGYVSQDNDIILDFFSGSATTAHAVMQLNAEDGGNRKFIMVQLPEVCAPESEAAKAGYKTICEIGKERIRRAGEKIAREHAAAAEKDTQYSLIEKGRQDRKTLDTGFRVFKLDSTNMKDVYYSAGDYRQEGLTNLISNIKEDRSDLDLLYACLLEWGLPLSLPHTSREIGGVPVHFYNDTDLVACFAKNVGEETIRGIARYQPLRVVFRDSSFADAPTKCNVEELFNVLAPHTTVKVL